MEKFIPYEKLSKKESKCSIITRLASRLSI